MDYSRNQVGGVAFKASHLRRKWFIPLFALFAFLLLINPISAQVIQVSPGGSSIQAAVDKAQPGDVIQLASGDYYEDFKSVRGGTASSPITIQGPKDAVIRGAGEGRVFEINHNYLTIKGITFNGLGKGDPNYQYSYRDKLVYVQGKGTREGVEGLKIYNVTFMNSGGEALRLRYFAKNNEIAYCTFLNNGVYDFKFNEGGKNGEAIYVGTSSNQWNDGKNPTSDPDESTNNWIHHNYFDTQGNECVDIKEGSKWNIVEYNICKGQKDPNSGGLDSRGDENTFRYNEVSDCAGAGIRLGGNTINGYEYGKNNYVYGNNLHDNEYGALKCMTSPQKDICGNVISSNGDGYGNHNVDICQKCPFALSNPPSGSSGGSTNSSSNSTTNNSGNGGADNDTDNSGNSSTNNSQVTGSRFIISEVEAGDDDGNIPQNTLDGNLATRWSAEGDGEYIQFKLEDATDIGSVGIAFYKGDLRVQDFEIHTSSDNSNWEEVFTGKSSGKTVQEQRFAVNATGKYVRIVGYGNSENDWNSLTEVSIYGTDSNNTGGNNSDNCTCTCVCDQGQEYKVSGKDLILQNLFSETSENSVQASKADGFAVSDLIKFTEPSKPGAILLILLISVFGILFFKIVR
jgi:hypothetical protein